MRYKLSFLAVLLISGAFLSGCARSEAKFGRGMTNLMEPVRLGEWRRSMEQTALFSGWDGGYATGFMRGLNRTVARTGVGLYEVVTAPFPSYDPIFTDYLSASPACPDSYKPNLLEDAMFATDANLGFSGGDVNPLIMGSRFRIFDTH